MIRREEKKKERIYAHSIRLKNEKETKHDVSKYKMIRNAHLHTQKSHREIPERLPSMSSFPSSSCNST